MTKQHAGAWFRWSVAVSALFLMAAGCSSSSKGTVTPLAPTRTLPPPAASGFVNASFQAKVSATCKTIGDALRADGSFPYPTFDPVHPLITDFPGIARYEAKTVAALRKWRTALDALGNPSVNTGTWDTFVAAVDQTVTSDIAQQHAAAQGDTATFITTYHDLVAHSEIATRAAAAIGLPSCDPGNPS
ncbi:MAG: hypothetical protein ACLPVY_03155 [Acidimicrobiia bacterium]